MQKSACTIYLRIADVELAELYIESKLGDKIVYYPYPELSKSPALETPTSLIWDPEEIKDYLEKNIILTKLRRQIANDPDLKDESLLSRVINAFLDSRHYTSRQLADALNISHPTLMRWRNGVTRPLPAARRSILEFLGQD